MQAAKFTPSGVKLTKFKTVDVWRPTFGPTSARAVFEIYAVEFGIPQTEMHNHSFRKCVDALRKLENPAYVAHV